MSDAAAMTREPQAGEDPASPRGDVVLRARGLCRGYRMGSQTLDVLTDVDIELHAGESVAIMGRSGAGKSTLLHSFGLLDRPDEGSLEILGQETTRLSRGKRARVRNRRIGFVFQFYHLIHELNALENAMLPRMIELGPLQWLAQRQAIRASTMELLRELGLEGRLHHRPSQLSGGERQRVAIARALVVEPSLLLCDEPTGNLDERTSEVIADLLFDLGKRRKHTLVLVTHDQELAARADHLLWLHDGKLQAVEEPAGGSPEGASSRT
jgi:lipoprotein-releasing system ATP-binding protein